MDNYQDANFEWTFVELTDRMIQYLEEDSKSIVKPRKHLDKHIAFRSFAHPDKKISSLEEVPHNEDTVRSSFTSYDTQTLQQNKTSLSTNIHGSTIDQLKEDLPEWNFDIFALNQLTNGHSFQVLAYEIFKGYNLIQKFKLSDNNFMRFIIQAEKHYRTNSYHNSTHAADVCQTLNCIMYKTGFVSILTDLEIFCTLITALIHDIEHTGTNNNFHKNSGSEMASMYVVSVLENHHIRVAMRMLREYDILRALSKEEFEDFKFMLTSMILATDMANHFMLITNMKLLQFSSCKCSRRIRIKRVLMLLLHAADISNPAKPWDIHKLWVTLLIEEFFQQGDREKDLKLPVTPNCDRNSANIATLQIGFMQTFAMDTFDVLDQLIEMETRHYKRQYYDFSPWQKCMEENTDKWSGKWKDLKFDQIKSLLTETEDSRKSLMPHSGGLKRSNQVACIAKFCCCFCRCCCPLKHGHKQEASYDYSLTSNNV